MLVMQFFIKASGGEPAILHQRPADVLAHLAKAVEPVEAGRDASVDLILPVAEIRIHQLLGAADAGVVRSVFEGI